MARERFINRVIQKIEIKSKKSLEKEKETRLKHLEQQAEKHRLALERKAEKQRIHQENQLKEHLLANKKIKAAIDNGELTMEELLSMPDIYEAELATWGSINYTEALPKLRSTIESGNNKDILMEIWDKKKYNPEFATTVKKLFSSNYSFAEYPPYQMHEDNDIDSISTKDLATLCAPHLLATVDDAENASQFGIVHLWRSRFTKHGLSLMAKNQYVRFTLFEQETNIPIFIIFGIGGTVEKPDEMYCIPFADAKSIFVPKPIAQRYKIDTDTLLKYIPQTRQIKQQ